MQLQLCSCALLSIFCFYLNYVVLLHVDMDWGEIGLTTRKTFISNR